MQKHISSLQNPAVKNILLLQEKSRTRRKERLFVIEGQREICLALKGNYVLNEIFFVPEKITPEEIRSLGVPSEVNTIGISQEVYNKIAYRGSTEGIIAVARTKDLSLEAVRFSKENPLILVAQAPEKPGNIGALLRTADAAGVDAVFIADPKTDLFNPNIIRSSVGCLFTTQVATGTSAEIISYLQSHHILIYGAALQASVPYDTIDFTKACAIVVGTEATGLSNDWLSHTTQNIVIPMQGEIDSMNVSVAAGILIFEARRQRGFV